MILDNKVEGKLAYIKANFGCLPSNTTHLQEKGVTVENPIDLVRKTENVAGDIGKLVCSKKTLATKQCAPSPEC
jgi:hypothetical protein